MIWHPFEVVNGINVLFYNTYVLLYYTKVLFFLDGGLNSCVNEREWDQWPERYVDLLVVMETPLSETAQAIQIYRQLKYRFGLDLLLFTPQYLAQRLAWGDSFLKEITTHGKVVYESSDTWVGGKGWRWFGHCLTWATRQAPPKLWRCLLSRSTNHWKVFISLAARKWYWYPSDS